MSKRNSNTKMTAVSNHFTTGGPGSLRHNAAYMG